MRKLFSILMLSVMATSSLQATEATSSTGMPLVEATGKVMPYDTVAQALKAMSSKPGIKKWMNNGWTIIEDPATLSLWSFAPANDPSYPTAVERKVSDGFIAMHVLCEADKKSCDHMVRQFEALTNQAAQMAH